MNNLMMPVGLLVANAASIIIQAFIPQYLSPAEYSKFTLLWTYGQLCVVIFFEWMRASLLRYSKGLDVELAKRRRRFLFGAYLTTVFIIIIISKILFILGQIWPIAIWASVALLYSVCQAVFDGSQVLYRTRFDNKKFVTSWMIRSILALVGAMGAAYLTGSGVYVVIGMALSFVTTVLVFNFRYLSRLSFSGINDLDSFKFLFGYGAFLALASISTSLFPVVTRTTSVALIGSLSAGGMLFALDIAQRTISTIGMGVNLVVMQRSIHAAEFSSYENKNNKITEQVAIVAGIVFPAGLGFFLIQDSVSALIVPEAYRETYLQGVAGACVCACLISFRSYGIDSIFVVSGKSKRTVLGSITSLILTIVCIFVSGWFFQFSVLQIILSMIVGLIFGTAISVINVTKEVDVKWPYRDFLIIGLASALMYLVVKSIGMNPGLGKLVLDLIFGIFTYMATLYMFDFVNLREKKISKGVK